MNKTESMQFFAGLNQKNESILRLLQDPISIVQSDYKEAPEHLDD